MKIYRVRADVNRYQYFLPKDMNTWQTGMLNFDGSSKEGEWNPPEVYSPYPKRKRGDFWNVSSGAFAVTPEATNKVRQFLEIAGEMLLLPYQDQQFAVSNVLECVDCLNRDQTEWGVVTDDGQKFSPIKYVFYPNRITDAARYGLFKIPETSLAETFVFEDSENPQTEFKAFVDSERMTGLLFDEVWPGSS